MVVDFLKQMGILYCLSSVVLIALIIFYIYLRVSRTKKTRNTKKIQNNTMTHNETEILSQGQEYRDLSIGTAISIGRRENQQDSLFPPKDLDEDIINSNGYLSILCDGMGGMECGELASQIACQEIAIAFYNKEYDGNFDKFIEQTVYYVDKMVNQLKTSDGKPARAGTTMICTLVKDDVFSWASVGDSRIYMVRDETITQLTRDHNYAMQLMAKGVSKERAEADEKSQALVSYIGMGGISVLDICNSVLLKDGDIIIMCSDGIYGTISDEQILKDALCYKNDMQKTSAKMLKTVLETNKPYQDNASLIMLSYNR